MEAMQPATERQVKLIERLYSDLRIRNTALYGGAQPAQLTKQSASDVIDVLTLRKLSSQLRRPVSADLADPAHVRLELARLEQLTDSHHSRHAAAQTRRTEHLRKTSAISGDGQQQTQPAAPRVPVLPHLRRHERPQPSPPLTAHQLAVRAAELDRDVEPRLAASQYSGVTGYGSGASYRAQQERSPSDAPQLTYTQEQAIIDLQDGGADATVSDTVAEASEYLDGAFAPAAPLPPTARQLDYLHRLERQAGKVDEELTHPGTRMAASRRIQRYLDAAERRQAMEADSDLAAAIALAAAASPHSIGGIEAITAVGVGQPRGVDAPHDLDEGAGR